MIQNRPLVLVYGEACVDYVASGVIELPKWGKSHPIRTLKKYAGGNGLNCAIALSVIGAARPIPVLKLGGDPDASFITQSLLAAGISEDSLALGLVADPAMVTPKVVVLVQDKEPGDRAFLHSNPYPHSAYSGRSTPTLRELEAALTRVPGDVKLHHFSGVGNFDALIDSNIGNYIKQLRSKSPKAIITADTVPVRSLKDKKIQKALGYFMSAVDFFVPSDVEAAMLTGKSTPEEQAKALILDYSCNAVIIKQNSAGVYYCDAKGRNWIFDAFPVHRVLDSTGAGDAWCAGFISALAQNLDTETACRMGNAAGHYCIGMEGPSLGNKTFADLRSLVDRSKSSNGSLFISYASDSSATMRKLAACLDSFAIKYYVDKRSMRPGLIEGQIDEMISCSDGVLLIVDNSSRVSPWVVHELEKARALKKTVYPVALEKFGDDFFSKSPIWAWVRETFHILRIDSNSPCETIKEIALTLRSRKHS